MASSVTESVTGDYDVVAQGGSAERNFRSCACPLGDSHRFSPFSPGPRATPAFRHAPTRPHLAETHNFFFFWLESSADPRVVR